MSAPLLSSVDDVEENTEHVPTNDRGTTISHCWSFNLVYYSENYLMIILFLSVFAISSHPVLIFVFLWVTLGMYIISNWKSLFV
ncbi:unnamed protein product [Rhizopus stolonifer]